MRRHVAGTMKTYDTYILVPGVFLKLTEVKKLFFYKIFSYFFVIRCSFWDLLKHFMANSRLHASERESEFS